MRLRMACEILLMLERFIASVALERFLPSVLSRVLVQITRRGTSIIALVTFERLLSCMISHHVTFQCSSCDARIVAHRASVRLFSSVRLLVLIQAGYIYCFIFTLIAMMPLFPGVLLDVPFEGRRSVT